MTVHTKSRHNCQTAGSGVRYVHWEPVLMPPQAANQPFVLRRYALLGAPYISGR